MVKNLLALDATTEPGANLATIAVVGSAHLDGMEAMLRANGWEARLPKDMIPGK